MIEAEQGKEGLEESKKTGNKIGRPNLEKEKLLIALRIYDSDQYSIKEIIEETGISQDSLYRAINKQKLEETKK
ncbi:TPA: recombinase family protein [Bacillus anthracis]|uniref:Resolvase n=2 Tax=Bacillus cereus group TaxID=86661 RepID=A0A2B0W4Z4_BACAN|nr:Transposon resolvase [Bacillus cereus]MBJ8061959.1 recombinase family protein [Bacillus cereus]PFL49912.1 resolvase [Bacillus anthracis]HDR7438122.1 recombinase family protein [Bacillus anthracis]